MKKYHVMFVIDSIMILTQLSVGLSISVQSKIKNGKINKQENHVCIILLGFT